MVVLVILASTINLAADNPNLERSGDARSILQGFEAFFTAFFCVEVLLKVLARGFAFHPHAYLRDPWNVVRAIFGGFSSR